MADRRFRALLASLHVFAASYILSFAIGCGGGSVGGPSTPTAPSTPSAPTVAAPAITALAPASVPAGSPAFTLQIRGTGFVSNSVASWNGTALTTIYVSATVLQAAVPAALAAAGGTFTITVSNPGGQTSASSNSIVTVSNPVPDITALSPASVTAGASATNVIVTGTGFLPGSTASFAGQPRATTVQSATQLTMALTAADLATSGQVNVTVANPAPGGGTSVPITFTVQPPPPIITGVTPASLNVGAPNTLVTITGSGFATGAQVMVDGLPQTPPSVTATTIQATVPASALQSAGSVGLNVFSGGLESNSFSVPVVNPVPAIQSISTNTVTAGATSFGVTIQATGLVNTTQVNLNGVPAAFSFNPLQVVIPTSLLAQVGTISVSLTNPSPGGGTSNTALLNVIAGTNYLRSVNLPANALVWNPLQQVIYAAIPASSGSNPNSVVAIDPGSGSVVASQPLPGEPNLLAISTDQQYLYVSMTAIATIARLKLPALTPDIQFTVGPVPSANYAVSIFDMQVAPGLPHTIAVAQATPGPETATQLAIYDDGVVRPITGSGTIAPFDDVNVLQWGADASTIYATENTVSGGPEFIYSVNAQGLTLTNANLGAFGGFETHLNFDSRENRLYDPQGDVVDAASGKSLGSFPTAGLAFTVDSAQRRVYFLGGTPYPEGVNSTGASPVPQIAVFDQDRFISEGTIALPAVNGTVPQFGIASLIRWGNAGLAFNTSSSIYILDGPFVTPGAVPSSTVGGYATPPAQLSGLSPESVVAGSPDVTITLTGQNFTPASTVSWNNNNLATTIVNNTEIQAVIPAAALTAPAAAPLYVENSPGEGISNVLAFSVLPQLGAGLQLTALNLSGTDLVWNAANNLLYVAVVNDDSLHPQSIATVDPSAGTLVSTLPLSANPYVLAISGDDQYLYTGFTNYANIQRYALPGLTPDLLIPLGIGDPPNTLAPGGTGSCDFAVSVEVAPQQNSTIAVTQGSAEIEPLGCGATVVIDGATPRPVLPAIDTTPYHDLSKLSWGADATALYAQGDDCCSGQPISSLTVSSTGVVFDQAVTTDIYLGYRPHFDVGTGLLYADGGAVIQPSTLALVGNFNASGLMVPDSTLGLAYFLGQTASQVGGNGLGTINYTLQIYNLKTFALLNSINIPNVIGFPNQMIRWGASGIAFTTEHGDLEGNNAPGLTYILSGPELSATTAASLQHTSAEPVHFTWQSHLRKRKALATSR